MQAEGAEGRLLWHAGGCLQRRAVSGWLRRGPVVDRKEREDVSGLIYIQGASSASPSSRFFVGSECASPFCHGWAKEALFPGVRAGAPLSLTRSGCMQGQRWAVELFFRYAAAVPSSLF